MKAIVIMFDSLNRRLLEPYGNTEGLTPNFQRLSQHSVTFDHFYAGSLPCMPARREMHTGRNNFLHRGWGPLEPFDDSAIELLKKANVYTHLITDHKHYWRDGGATYHNRFNSYELVRGQEGDLWIGQVHRPILEGITGDSEAKKARKRLSRTQDLINRQYMDAHHKPSMVRVMDKAFEFLETNAKADQWLLQVECFDPHEPYYVPEEYLQKVGVKGRFDGWPEYYPVTEDADRYEMIRGYYKALLMMADDYLGRLLDKVDALKLWEDTLIILCTDHGFLLGEHDWWGKSFMPVYNDLAQLPFMLWDPRLKHHATRFSGLSQTIDIGPTLLEFFGQAIPSDMMGVPLTPCVRLEQAPHSEVLFGYFGCNVNWTDGRYVYLRSAQESPAPLYEFTLMPTRINRRFTPDELKNASLREPFTFTKQVPVLKIPSDDLIAPGHSRFGNRLYDLKKDPEQKVPLQDARLEAYCLNALRRAMIAGDADESTLIYYGVNQPFNETMVREAWQARDKKLNDAVLAIEFENHAIREGTLGLLEWMDPTLRQRAINLMQHHGLITQVALMALIDTVVEPQRRDEALYRVGLYLKID